MTAKSSQTGGVSTGEGLNGLYPLLPKKPYNGDKWQLCRSLPVGLSYLAAEPLLTLIYALYSI